MKQLVVEDELIMTAEALKVHFKAIYKKRKKFPEFQNVIFGGDDTFLCDYLLYAVANANQKFPIFKDIKYLTYGNISDYRTGTLNEAGVASFDYDALKSASEKNNLFYFFIDSTALNNKEKTLTELSKMLELAKNKKSKFVLSVVLPEIKAFKEGATSLSERELSFYIEKMCEKSPEVEYYLEIEKLLRNTLRENDFNITLLRFDNVFSPDFYNTPCVDFKAIIEECVSTQRVVITDDDYKRKFTVSYVRDACENIFLSSAVAKKGHIYNVASSEISVADIKELIFEIYPDKFDLEKNLSSKITREYSCMNCLKFNSLELETAFSLSTAVKHVVSYLSELEYDISDNTAFYAGKIKTIQALEVEILKEIDRICVENDIKYFLAGGSLLGAVRSGGSIPWDDDLDIGMLRKDYQKFRKICEENLQEKFEFSSPFNGSGSHYTIEKVRLKSTYFSTTYSAKNVFPDGVFVDILVYDQTSNFRPLRVIQSFILVFLYYCIILRWYNEARRKHKYYATKIILPFLRIFPLGFYHWWFEFFVKLFMNKKDATLLIDSVGKKLKDGPLPKAGLEDTVYVDFDGIKAPIPVDYTGYLNYAYGPDYMEKPNYGKRKCPHNFARIDLGKYIFDVKGETPFREVDLRGELFESEDEK
ncbi:MAG: hypothetical protein E7557_09445 [Ruminococcaceae bacterium]|nr:hypothetical protein [Oscillospiraceae bacterium]